MINVGSAALCVFRGGGTRSTLAVVGGRVVLALVAMISAWFLFYTPLCIPPFQFLDVPTL
jgi:hypothetical protein